jgi:hypothetical protein
MLGWVMLWLASVPPAIAQIPARGARAGQDPLATKQQIARDRMMQLEDRMFRLAESLADREPEQAKRLEGALRRARELLVRHSMDESIELLNQGRLTDAVERESAVVKSLEQVLLILMEEPDRSDSLKKELERLDEYKREVESLLERERALRDRTRELKDELKPQGDGEKAAEEQRKLREEADRLARRMEGDAAEGEENSDGSQGEPGKKAEPSNRDGQQDSSREPGEQNPDTSDQHGEKSSPGEQSASDSSEQQGDSAQSESSKPSESGQQSPSGSQSGEPSPSLPQPPAPGAQQVEQSGQHMQQAAEKLDEGDPRQAEMDENQAIQQLQRALDELERTLDQLRREQQEEMLRGLESRLRALLAGQVLINESTLQLDDKGRESWTRSDELAVAGLAQDEKGLIEQARSTLHVLEEEGTTIVFPQVIEQLTEDMGQVADLLGQRDTGEQTQRIETAITETLNELIDSVKQIREEMQSGQRGTPRPGGANQPPPLLPASAELKLLRSCQERVNARTRGMEEEMDRAGSLSPEMRERLRRIADRQRELAEMARRMNERATGQ